MRICEDRLCREGLSVLLEYVFNLIVGGPGYMHYQGGNLSIVKYFLSKILNNSVLINETVFPSIFYSSIILK